MRNAVTIIAVGLWTSTVVGQTVVNEYTPHLPVQQFAGPTGYVDINGSQQTVLVPAGRAVLTWSLSLSKGFSGDGVWWRLRPAIGGNTPTEGLSFHAGPSSFSSPSGSWATDVEGGQVVVKLQTSSSGAGSWQTTSDDSLSWTLVVYPQGDAPALGTWGIVILALVIVTGGSMVIGKRKVAA